MAIPTKTLADLRTLAQRLSDMENSSFISTAEWNTYLNLGLQELYDLFAEVHGQEFFLKTQAIQLQDDIAVYTLADDFHVLKGVDWLDSEPPSTTHYLLDDGSRSDTSPAFGSNFDEVTLWVPDRTFPDHTVPLKPYMFFERHDGTNTEHGRMQVGAEERMRFRVFTERRSSRYIAGGEIGSTAMDYEHRIRFNPLGSGWVLVWYLPSPPSLTEDTDVMVGFHGYEEYVSMFAAIRALRKEESDWSSLAADLEAMKQRIHNMGSNRDMGHPSRVQDMTRSGF